MNLRLLTIAAALLLPAYAANAQLSISWYTIDGGGGTSTGGSFTLRGTIGQHDAAAPLSGGSFTLSPGFWPGPADAPIGCGTADFDGDGDIGTDADIEAFFACLAGNCCPTCFVLGADFNADGDIGTDADIEAFFRVLAGGNC